MAETTLALQSDFARRGGLLTMASRLKPGQA